MKMTTFLANFILDSGLNTAFDTTGIIDGRTGAAPTNAGDALTGTVLYTIPMAAAAFGAAAGAVLTGSSVPWTDTSADASGTVGYAVMRLSGDATTGSADGTLKRILLTVGAGSGEMNHDTLTITAAQQVSVTSFTFTQPLT